MSEIGFVPDEILKKVKVGKNYVAAKYGFRNHWYPAFLSSDLKEGEPRPVRLCGERILVKRIDGAPYAIKDQCLHKGVPLSRKVECYTKDTISCWYHGWTYRFSDGELCGIVGVPESNVIGRRKIKTYPAQEAKGVVFIFVGDDDFAPPPLVEDVPPMFLDANVAIHGRWQEVHANWRLGCENGFDSTHIFIHKDSVLIEDADLMLPLGLVPKHNDAFQTQEEDGGPKGVFDFFTPDKIDPVFEGKVGGETVLMGAVGGKTIVPHEISMWLPCALRVHPWPHPEITQFEWYVPIDDSHHIYFQFLAKRVSSAEEEAAFEKEFHERWVPKALIGFNQDDIWAREANEPFYADDTGWLNENLFEADGNIVRWRDLASRLNRGIQKPEHIR